MSWSNPYVDGEVHVVPNGDLREHECRASCWCHPTEDDEVSGLFIHHSLDGREHFETGERQPS